MNLVSSSVAVQNDEVRESILSDIFITALRNAELKEARMMFHVEVDRFGSLLDSRYGAPLSSEIDRLSTVRTCVFRICLHYESSVALAVSILDLSARLASNILAFSSGLEVDHKMLGGQIESESLSEVDPFMANFLVRIRPTVSKLIQAKEEIPADLARMVAVREDRAGPLDLPLVYETLKDLGEKLDDFYQLVQDYVRFMDKYLAGKF